MESEIKLFEAISLAKKVKKIEKKKAKNILAESYRSLAYLAILEQNMHTASDYYKKAYSLKKF
jgi:lipopolysaccharide biosynthesis regulator YciM